jgi:mRNA interferase MazF
MRRGEVWWAQLRPPSGPKRPVLLLHRDHGYAVLSGFVAAEITRTVREISSCVLLTKADGMPTRCVVSCDNLVTVPRDRLVSRMTSLSSEKMRSVDTALRFVLALR